MCEIGNNILKQMQKGNIGIFRYFSTRSVILCGIETHACIHHTALDLIERGIEVSVLYILEYFYQTAFRPDETNTFHTRFTFLLTVLLHVLQQTENLHFRD